MKKENEPKSVNTEVVETKVAYTPKPVVEEETNFLINKIVKIVPIVRPGSWSYKYSVTEDGKDKTNGNYQFNTAITYLSVPVSKKTGLILRPLDNVKKVKTPQYEDRVTEQEFFERMLGMNAGDLDTGKTKQDEKGNRYLDTFWQTKGTVKIRNEANTLDLSTPMDMIKYKVLLLNSTVIAKSPAEKNKKRTFRFMLVDQEVAEVQEKQEFSIKLEAFSEFNRIKADIKKLKEIMWLNDARITNSTNYDYVFTNVAKIVEDSPSKFLSIIKDAYKDSKLLLMQANKIGALVVTKEKTYQFLDGKDIGPQINAIKFLENPENFAVVQRLKEQSNID
jgi:hypothetical protein